MALARRGGSTTITPDGLRCTTDLPTTVFNGSSDFQLQGSAALFLFATLDGTINGWPPQSNFNEAIMAVDDSANKAVYTGLAITSRTSGNLLYAADEANGKVDMYDTNFALVKSFTDTTLPAGFAPFGIQDINGLLYVTFANVNGDSGGFVDLFKEDGTFVKTLIKGAPLTQPWGVAAAPRNFGPLSGTLLVSNNTNNGTINAFDPSTGALVGKIKNEKGKPVVIDQLWGIAFPDNTGANGVPNHLYFTAGPKQSSRYFGSDRIRPRLVLLGVHSGRPRAAFCVLSIHRAGSPWQRLSVQPRNVTFCCVRSDKPAQFLNQSAEW